MIIINIIRNNKKSSIGYLKHILSFDESKVVLLISTVLAVLTTINEIKLMKTIQIFEIYIPQIYLFDKVGNVT